MSSKPLTTADLIFSTQSLDLSSTLHSLKRSALSVHNRLSSIIQDSRFVCSVAEAYGLPLVANERCGSWYIPLEKKVGSVYFKSTDGHMNEWSFSMRRLNLHFLDVVGKWSGAVVVDSTRRGKSMPDALSKTVPIWCCVLNRAMFPELGPHPLFTPPQAVSPSEHSQIEKRIDGFVQQFRNTYTSPLEELKKKLQKPLRPLWVTQESTLPPSPPSFPEFHPIVLCTASRRVRGGEVSEGGYIQGAADDHEAWADGLTPQIFWSNNEKLLTKNEEDLPELISSLITQSTNSNSAPVLIKPTTAVYILTGENLPTADFDTILTCGPSSPQIPAKGISYLHLSCRAGKLGSRDLRSQLTQLAPFMARLAHAPNRFLICSPAADLSLGIALALLCLYTSDAGVLQKDLVGNQITKNFIRQRLTWLTTANPAFNPSRETLKAVNAFLMPDPSSVSTSTPGKKPNSQDDSNGPSNPSSSPKPKTSLPFHAFSALATSTDKPWKLSRTLTSRLPTHPSGTVTGTATFVPCATGSEDYVSAYLYSEEGEFVTDNGLRFNARRKYIYRLKKPSSPSDENSNSNPVESIEIDFFDDEKAVGGDRIGEAGEGIGGLFVEMGSLDFESTWSGTMKAPNKESHLCIDDLYGASWRFGSGMFGEGGEGDKWWEVTYEVKGPKKDYVSVTKYEL